MNERPDGQERSRVRFFVELFERDANGRKMIAWGRRIGCRDAGSVPDEGIEGIKGIEGMFGGHRNRFNPFDPLKSLSPGAPFRSRRRD